MAAPSDSVDRRSVIIEGACPATNISAGINYYSIVVDADNIKLATTKANAISNTAITFVGGGSVIMCRQPTLNLNGTGAIPIRNSNTSGASLNNNYAPSARAYQNHIVYGALTYDAGLNVWIKYGADQADTLVGFGSNVPPEACLLRLPWRSAHIRIFVSPFATLEPNDGLHAVTDGNTFMTMLPRRMIPRFEVYNETWNTTPGTSYGCAKSWLNWIIQEGNPHDWVGKVGSTLGQAAAVVWPGGKGINYHILIGVQTSPITNPGQRRGAGDNRLAASQYVAHGPTQPPLTGSCRAPSPLPIPRVLSIPATHVCCTQYITPTLWGTNPGVTPNVSRIWRTHGP